MEKSQLKRDQKSDVELAVFGQTELESPVRRHPNSKLNISETEETSPLSNKLIKRKRAFQTQQKESFSLNLSKC